MTNMKRRAQHIMEPTSQVINHCITNVSQACQGALPSHSALRKKIRRKRNEINFAPPEPLDLESLEIPEEYSVYEIRDGESENFLLYDSGPNIDRILIFGRQSNIERFMDTTTLFMDGTFKISPTLFCQLYTISGMKHGGVNPILYALLPNKRKATYDRLFEQLRTLMPSFATATHILRF